MNVLVMDFINALRGKIREDMNNYSDDLATGMCHDFASYQKLCGVIQGLAIAERHILDLADHLREDNDE